MLIIFLTDLLFNFLLDANTKSRCKVSLTCSQKSLWTEGIKKLVLTTLKCLRNLYGALLGSAFPSETPLAPLQSSLLISHLQLGIQRIQKYLRRTPNRHLSVPKPGLPFLAVGQFPLAGSRGQWRRHRGAFAMPGSHKHISQQRCTHHPIPDPGEPTPSPQSPAPGVSVSIPYTHSASVLPSPPTKEPQPLTT